MTDFYKTTASYRWIPSGSTESTKYDDYWFAILNTTESKTSIDPNMPMFKDIRESYDLGEINLAQRENLEDFLRTKLTEIYSRGLPYNWSEQRGKLK